MNLQKLLKVSTGIIIVPLGIIASKLWPWWERQSMPVKTFSAIIVLPYMLIVAPVTHWWDNY